MKVSMLGLLILIIAVCGCTRRGDSVQYQLQSQYLNSQVTNPDVIFAAGSSISSLVKQGQSPFDLLTQLESPLVVTEQDQTSIAEGKKVTTAIHDIYSRQDKTLRAMLASLIDQIHVGKMPGEYGATTFVLDNGQMYFDAAGNAKFHDENPSGVPDTQMYEYYILDLMLAQVLREDVKSRCEIEWVYFETFYGADKWDLILLNAYEGLKGSAK